MASHVSHSRDADGLVVLELHDSAGRNAFSEPLVMQLHGALVRIAADREARAVVLAGLSDVFCSGAPRELLLRLGSGELSPADILLAKAVLDLPVPVIAAMEGHATGGGLALGLCADIVVMARESRYGCTFMNMGFTPGMGITRLLEHVLSPAVAHELMFTGELRRGSDFEGRSGFNHVLPRADVRPKALDLARRIVEKPRVALVLLKRALSAPRRRAFEESRTLESLMHDVSFSAPDIRERIEAGYAE